MRCWENEQCASGKCRRSGLHILTNRAYCTKLKTDTGINQSGNTETSAGLGGDTETITGLLFFMLVCNT